MLYIAFAALSVAVYAVVIWYFAGQVRYVIEDQRLEDPFYKWVQVKYYMATPLIVFYLLVTIWFVVVGTQFGFFDRISHFYDTMTFSSGSLLRAGGFTVALILLAALPATACVWLEGRLERKYKSNSPNRDEKSWRSPSLTIVS